MIISDLNYMESAVEASVVGGSSRGGRNRNEFNKQINSEVNTNLNTNVDVDFFKDFDLTSDIVSNVDLEDNVASIIFDAEALGEDSLVEVDVAVLTVENELSSVSGSIVSVTD
jgi:hypothetical protein